MRFNRREFLSAAAAAAVPPQPRPNVLAFMTDQESALAPAQVNAPNRRRIEQSGVRFSNAFCNTPQCSAARSTLLTGLEPHHTGVLTNVDNGSLGKPLSPSLPTVGTAFRAAGYRTAYFGKWHLGNDDDGLERFGFPVYAQGSDEKVAKAAAAWIREQTGPWLAWISVLNPHQIYSLPKELASVNPRVGVKPPATDLRNLAGKPAEQRGYVDEDQGRATKDFSAEDWVRYRSFYCGLIEKADACLGTALDSVRDLKSTVVAYLSDHGDALGEHGLPFKGPFMYEPLIRIPFVVHAPGRLKPGVRQDFVTQADLAPTLASLAGIDWSHKSDGRDLTQASKPRDAVFLEYYAKQKWVNPIRTIRTERWKMNWYNSGNKELYDLREDPDESRNLAGAPGSAKIQRELESRLDAWRPPIS
jgi:arylsulfatase A-like enzyme